MADLGIIIKSYQFVWAWLQWLEFGQFEDEESEEERSLPDDMFYQAIGDSQFD